MSLGVTGSPIKPPGVTGFKLPSALHVTAFEASKRVTHSSDVSITFGATSVPEQSSNSYGGGRSVRSATTALSVSGDTSPRLIADASTPVGISGAPAHAHSARPTTPHPDRRARRIVRLIARRAPA